jgi:hypothetical protein
MTATTKVVWSACERAGEWEYSMVQERVGLKADVSAGLKDNTKAAYSDFLLVEQRDNETAYYWVVHLALR